LDLDERLARLHGELAILEAWVEAWTFDPHALLPDLILNTIDDLHAVNDWMGK